MNELNVIFKYVNCGCGVLSQQKSVSKGLPLNPVNHTVIKTQFRLNSQHEAPNCSKNWTLTVKT